jgi:gliding motility-associated-like protein
MLLRTGKALLLFLLVCLTYARVSAQCTATLNSIPPTCSSSGGYQLIIPVACVGPTPYTLFWGIPGGCPNPTLTTVNGPGTYSVLFAAPCATAYNVAVLDANSNVLGGGSAPVGVNGPQSVAFNITASVQPKCFGNCNGSITLFWTGNGPLTVTLDPGPGQTVYSNVPVFAGQTYTGLCASTLTPHSFNVLDASGCTYTSGLTFTLGQPTALGVNTATSQPSCNGGSNGTFSVAPTGATPGYTVVFSNSSTVTVAANGTAVATGLPAGVISATVTDTKGCTLTTSVNLGQPTAINIVPTQTDVTCGGACIGAASVAVSGGGGTYTYTWNPGPGNSPGITGLCGATGSGSVHTVNIKDNNNCLVSRSFSITQPIPITITPTLTNLVCNNICAGSASATASGPPGPFSFTWTAPGPTVLSTSSVVSSLCATDPSSVPIVYTITANSASNPTCTVNYTFSLTQPSDISITPSSQSLTCRNVCTGSAAVTPSNGNGPPYSYTWSPVGAFPGSNAQSIIGLCAGNYPVIVADVFGCTKQVTVAIAEPPVFTSGVTTTSILCNGSCTGSVVASPSGGTPPYQYTLAVLGTTLMNATGTFTGLCANNNYTLFIGDQAFPTSCSQTFAVNMQAPNPFIASISATNVACNSASTGALSGNVVGGTAGYTLNWQTPGGPQPGGVLTNQPAGPYTLTVVDSHNCSTSSSTTLTQPSAFTVTASSSTVSCFSSNNGIVSVNVSGASPGYTVVWQPGGFQGNPYTGLNPGTYSYTVTDANTCTTVGTASVSSPAALSSTVSTTQVSCLGGAADGSATITVSGGTTPYVFSLGAATNTTGIFAGLGGGAQTATITDNNFCTAPATFVIVTPSAALTASVSNVQSSCTFCSGAATVVASGGTPGYTYTWSAGTGTGASIGSLCPGSATVTIKDAKSCTMSPIVFSVSPIVILVAGNGGGINCFGANTGTAGVTSISGGSPPYTYTWSPAGGTASTAITLTAGVYTVTATDNGSPGCTATQTVNVPQPPDITVTFSQANIVCTGDCTGVISATASGGTGGLSYTLTGGAPPSITVTGGSSAVTVNNLCAGVYTLTFKDGNACTDVTTYTIAAPFPSLTAAFQSTNPTQCVAPNDGIICVTAGGGNSTYTYSWVTVPGTPTASCVNSLTAGTYSVFITSAGCTQTFVSSLFNPSGPTLTFVNSHSVDCFGGNNGAATFSASGSGPFTFSWSPAVPHTTVSPTTSATSMPAGNYIVTAVDVLGCATPSSISILQPTSAVSVNGTVTNVQCFGAGNGSVQVTGAGGSAGYTYSWMPSGATSTAITGLGPGTYTVQVTDGHTCQAAPRTFTVTEPPALTFSTVSSQSVLCFGQCNASISYIATGGTGTPNFTLTGPNSSTAIAGTGTGTSSSIGSLCFGSYTLTIRDANSCSNFTTVTIAQPSVALSSIITTANETCHNSCNGLAANNASGGTPPYTYSWSVNSTTTSVTTSLCAGATYSATVTDFNGCFVQRTFSMAAVPLFSVDLTAIPAKCQNTCNGAITTTVHNAQGPVTFSWSPAGSGPNPTNLCGGITYNLLATDGNNCQWPNSILVTQPNTSISANPSTVAPQCHGDCNGVVFSSPLNAVGNTTITWTLPPSSVVVSPTVTGLCAGNYTVTVVDDNQCTTGPRVVTLTDPNLLTIVPSVAPATCGQTNGSITAVGNGGTQPYTYLWSPGSNTTSMISGLGAGLYTVLVTDATSCTNTAVIPLSNSNGPIAPLTATNILCNGLCTGAASVGVISSGTPSYAINWLSLNMSTHLISNLCAGTYTAQLSDSLNCLTFTSIAVTQPQPISVFSNISLPTCVGVCDGSVTLNTSGGATPYTYTWVPNVSTTSVITNLCGGNYAVLIVDSNQCSFTYTMNIPGLNNIVAAPPSVTNNICFGNCLGAANILILSTTTPSTSPTATLAWNNGQFGNTAVNLCAGVYTVTATDTRGCMTSFNVPVTAPSQITVTNSIVQPSCNVCNGSSSVTASGGTGPSYSFSWTTGALTQTVGNLCAGLYQVQIADANNCTQVQNIIINNSNGIASEAVITVNELCAGNCNGSATITPTGGTPPINFNWINPVLSNTTNMASGLCGGTYFVQMTDAQNCIRTTPITINAATQLTLSTFITPPTCAPNPPDGTVSIVVAGGSIPYTYLWSPGGSTLSTLTNIGPGNYTVTVTDKAGTGCSTTQVVSVNNLNGPRISSSQQNVNCFGSNNGSITVNITSGGGTPTFGWSTGATGSGNTATIGGLGPGIVNFTVTENGCTSVNSYSITEANKLELNTTAQNVVCNNDCNGIVTLMPLGGTLTYSFTLATNTSTINQFLSLCPGNYTAVVADANGCTVNTVITIGNTPPITSTINPFNSSCSTLADGSVSLAITGGQTPFIFIWTGPANYTANTQNISGLFEGSYSVTMLDLLGCAKSATAQVVPTVTIDANAGPDQLLCPRSTTVISGSNSSGAVAYNWMVVPNTNTISNAATYSIVSAIETETYQLIAFSSLAGCIDRDTVVVDIYPEPYLDAGPSYTIPVYSTVQIGGNPTSTGASGTFTWFPAMYLDDASAQNPVASNTVYTTFTVMTIYGSDCVVLDTMHVELYPEVKVTSGFSPNNDGKNDLWIIDYIDQFPDNTVEIYNRWGDEIFSSKGYLTPFDGKYKGRDLPVGTYYYVIHLNHPGYPKPITGPLTIFR